MFRPDDEDDLHHVSDRQRPSFTMLPIHATPVTPPSIEHERDAAEELANGVSTEDLRDGWIPRAPGGSFPGLRARAKSASPTKLSSNVTIHYRTKSDEHVESIRLPYFTYAMITVNIIMFVVTMATVDFKFASISANPLLGPETTVLRSMGAKDTVLIRNGDWWRIFTSGFLHTSIGHLLVNMLVLYRIGGSMEETFGFASMAIIYFGSLVVASLSSCIFLPSLMSVGASGAIYGVVGSMIADYIQNYEIMPDQTFYLPSLILNICLGFGIGLIPYIDNFSHIAGFFSGLLIGLGVLILPRFDSVRSRFYKRRSTLIVGVTGAFGYCLILTSFIILTAKNVDLNQYCANCKYLSCIPTSYWCCQLPDKYMNC